MATLAQRSTEIPSRYQPRAGVNHQPRYGNVRTTRGTGLSRVRGSVSGTGLLSPMVRAKRLSPSSISTTTRWTMLGIPSDSPGNAMMSPARILSGAVRRTSKREPEEMAGYMLSPRVETSRYPARKSPLKLMLKRRKAHARASVTRWVILRHGSPLGAAPWPVAIFTWGFC